MFYKMVMIVISRVLKYRAFIIALALVSALAFFQSNQSQSQQRLPSNLTDNETSESEQAQPPSIPETPDLPDTPDSPDSEEGSKTSISISINTNTNGEDSDTSVDIDTTPQIPLDELADIEEEFKDGSGNLNIDLDTDEDGHSEVNLRTRFRQKTVNKSSFEQDIDREENHD